MTKPYKLPPTTVSTGATLLGRAEASVSLLQQWRDETPTEAFSASIKDSLGKLEYALDKLPNSLRLPKSNRSRLNSVGVALWNDCRARVQGAHSDDDDTMKIACRVLAAAATLLDISSSFTRCGFLRACKLAIEAAWVCIDRGQFEGALRASRSLAKRLDTIEQLGPTLHKSQRDSITADYHMLRAHLAWKQGQIDIADHFITKISPEDIGRDRSNMLADHLSIGRISLEAGNVETAIKWLELALWHLSKQLDAEDLTSSGLELHIRHTLAWAYLRNLSQDTCHKLRCQIAVLKAKFEFSSAVQLLELEFIRRRVVKVQSISLADIAEYARVSGLLLGSSESYSRKADYLIPLTWLATEMEDQKPMAGENVLNLAGAVLHCARQALERSDVRQSILSLEGACLDSYNLVLFTSHLAHQNESAKILELSQEVQKLARQRFESMRAESHEGANLEDNEIQLWEPVKSQIDYVAYQLLFLEVSIRTQIIESLGAVELQHEHHKKVLKAIQSIRQLSRRDCTWYLIDDDASSKLCINEFQASVALKEWNNLPAMLNENERYLDVALFTQLANCVLRSDMPDTVLASTLHQLLTLGRKCLMTTYDYAEGLPKWLRPLFQHALAAAKSETPAQRDEVDARSSSDFHKMAEFAIDEMLTVSVTNASEADSLQQQPRMHSFESPEAPSHRAIRPKSHLVKQLEYLATCTFNQAMDFYSAEDDEACMRWAEKAGQLAKRMGTPQGDHLKCLFEERLKILLQT